MNKKCHIVCFGNELHGDDGFGIRIHEELCRQNWLQEVSLFNAGIAGINALRFLEHCEQAILVDALAGFGEIGEICVVKPEQVAKRSQSLSSHGLGLPFLLEALKTIRVSQPTILIVGVEVAAIQSFSLNLSDATEKAVPETVQLIKGLVSV